MEIWNVISATSLMEVLHLHGIWVTEELRAAIPIEGVKLRGIRVRGTGVWLATGREDV